MKSVQLAWVFGAVSALGLGMAAEACSSSSSPTINPPVDGGHSGTGSTTGSGTSNSSATGTSSGTATSGSTSSTSGASSSSGSCFAAPGDLFPEDGGVGVYCPFSATTDGGKAIHCMSGQHCCEPPESAAMASTCEPTATACGVMDSTDWVCEGTPDCAGNAGGSVCCGAGTIETQGIQPGCAADGGTLGMYQYVKTFTGTSCAASCSLTMTTFQVCSKDSECPGGAAGSCVSIKPKGNGIGYCASSGSGSGSSSSSSSSSGSSTGSGSSSASTSSSGSAGH